MTTALDATFSFKGKMLIGQFDLSSKEQISSKSDPINWWKFTRSSFTPYTSPTPWLKTTKTDQEHHFLRKAEEANSNVQNTSQILDLIEKEQKGNIKELSKHQLISLAESETFPSVDAKPTEPLDALRPLLGNKISSFSDRS